MRALELVKTLQGRGVRLAARDDALLVDAPKGAVQPDELAALRAQKAEILSLLAGAGAATGETARPALNDAAGWQARLGVHLYQRARLDYPISTATSLAHGHVLVEMHTAITASSPPDTTICAGCDQVLAGARLDTGDGARVHDAIDHACLIAYGRRWRRRAADRLAALGIEVPAEVVEVQ